MAAGETTARSVAETNSQSIEEVPLLGDMSLMQNRRDSSSSTPVNSVYLYVGGTLGGFICGDHLGTRDANTNAQKVQVVRRLVDKKRV